MKSPLFRLLIMPALLLASIILSQHYCKAAITKKVLKIYPSPSGTASSRLYKVTADGRPVPTYEVKVSAGNLQQRLKAIDDPLHTDQFFDIAAFAYFDLHGSSNVTVTATEQIRSVKILPTSAGIKGKISGRSVSFVSSRPQNLTVEINGDIIRSLHIFINPVETYVPSPRDPNVIYFGPGVHRVSHMAIGDNKTVYIAGGAVIKAIIDPNETYSTESGGLKNYKPTFQLLGNNIKFLGHGVIDASECSNHARNMLNLHGSEININGPILVNASGWTVPVRQCRNVTISNLKLLGFRANSDGIDICNSSNVTVSNCFVRTGDDLIVIKTEAGEGPSNNIIIKNCVLWNQTANALSLGAELRHDVSDVLFSNCDVIHDIGRAWGMHIFHSDASVISNVRFDHIRFEESHQFINLWIGKTKAESYDQQFGHIRNIIFSNITANGSPLNIDLVGGTAQSQIENVQFVNVKLNGKPLIYDTIKQNPFVKNVTIAP